MDPKPPTATDVRPLEPTSPAGPELFVPPLWLEESPRVGGRIGSDPEHFCVEELPLYEASGSGEHWYVFVEKRGLTTQDLIQAIGRVAGVRAADIGSAGMKDKHAVTRQWLSVPGTGRAPETWAESSAWPAEVRLLAVSRHNNKLRTGHLRGNRFAITLVDVPPEGLGRARALLSELERRGLPNYYGPQRFGRGGSSFRQALQWLREATSESAPEAGERQEGRKGRGARRGGHRRHTQTKLLSSVIQADVFNRYLARRLSRPEPLLPGEVVRLDGSSRHFVVEDVDKELPRLLEKDIHRTGPLPGPRTLKAAQEAAELEERAAEELGLSATAWEELGRTAPGARRDLLVFPTDVSVEEPAPGTLTVHFALDAGSYATQLIRELTGSPWFELR